MTSKPRARYCVAQLAPIVPVPTTAIRLTALCDDIATISLSRARRVRFRASTGGRRLIGLEPRQAGIEHGVLGLLDRGVREVDRGRGVILRALGAALGVLDVLVGLCVFDVPADLGDVPGPVLLNVSPRARRLRLRAGGAGLELGRPLLGGLAGLLDLSLEVRLALRLGGSDVLLGALGAI